MKKQFLSVLLVLIFLFLGLGKSDSSLVDDKPDFVKVGDYSLKTGERNELEFNITVVNNGEPATAGFVPIMWETIYYEIPLTNGEGILEESEVDYDLNDDNDKLDTFNVVRFENNGRLWDAKISDNGEEVHAYSICEGPIEDPWSIRRYYYEEQPKLFNLGTETHFLYLATDSIAVFGLVDGEIVKHPSPNFELFIDSDKIEANDFFINGEAVEANYTDTVASQELYYNDNEPYPQTVYVLNNPEHGFEIGSGEEVTFSCTFKAQENITCRVFLLMNWSPDGNLRYRPWAVLWEDEVTFLKYISEDVPGFTFFTPLLLILPLSVKGRKMRKNRSI